METWLTGGVVVAGIVGIVTAFVITALRRRQGLTEDRETRRGLDRALARERAAVEAARVVPARQTDSFIVPSG